MTCVRVYIATTEGPVEIQRLAVEDPDVHSVVCLNSTPQALPISPDYDAFVRKPTGIIERLYGHGVYRMDVAEPIGHGHSWQLAAFAAHALAAAKRLAGPQDKAAQVLWLSGEVDSTLRVKPIAHVAEKLQQSQALFAHLQAKNLAVTVVLPTANQAQITALPAAVKLLTLTHVDALLKALTLPAVLRSAASLEPTSGKPTDAPPAVIEQQPQPRTGLRAGLLALLLLTLAGLVYSQFGNPLRTGSMASPTTKAKPRLAATAPMPSEPAADTAKTAATDHQGMASIPPSATGAAPTQTTPEPSTPSTTGIGKVDNNVSRDHANKPETLSQPNSTVANASTLPSVNKTATTATTNATTESPNDKPALAGATIAKSSATPKPAAPAKLTALTKPAISTKRTASAQPAAPVKPAAPAIPASPRLTLRLYALRPPKNSNCAAVRFGQTQVVEIEQSAQADNRYQSRQLERLCGIAVTLNLPTTGTPPVKFQLSARLLQGDRFFAQSTLFQNIPSRPGPSAHWQFLFPRRLRKDFLYQLTITATTETGQQVLARQLIRHQGN